MHLGGAMSVSRFIVGVFVGIQVLLCAHQRVKKMFSLLSLVVDQASTLEIDSMV